MEAFDTNRKKNFFDPVGYVTGVRLGRIIIGGRLSLVGASRSEQHWGQSFYRKIKYRSGTRFERRIRARKPN